MAGQGINLAHGINMEVWLATTQLFGCSDPHSPATIRAVADRMHVRYPTAYRWHGLAPTDYPVHCKSTLCRFAEVLGTSVPKEIHVQRRTNGTNWREAERLAIRGTKVTLKTMKRAIAATARQHMSEGQKLRYGKLRHMEPADLDTMREARQQEHDRLNAVTSIDFWLAKSDDILAESKKAIQAAINQRVAKLAANLKKLTEPGE